MPTSSTALGRSTADFTVNGDQLWRTGSHCLVSIFLLKLSSKPFTQTQVLVRHKISWPFLNKPNRNYKGCSNVSRVYCLYFVSAPALHQFCYLVTAQAKIHPGRTHLKSKNHNRTQILLGARECVCFDDQEPKPVSTTLLMSESSYKVLPQKP